MSDRIRIQDFRDLHVIDSGDLDHGQVLVEPDDLFALVQAVEAAHRLHKTTSEHSLDNDITPFGVHTEYAAASFRLGELLDRFDFGEQS